MKPQSSGQLDKAGKIALIFKAYGEVLLVICLNLLV